MLSVKSIGGYLLMIVLVMVGIYAVKWASAKWNIPVLSTVSEGV